MVLVEIDRLVAVDVLAIKGAHELLAILVTKSSDMVLDTCSGELLLKRNLLELHVMHTGTGGTQQRGGCNQSVLHVGSSDQQKYKLCYKKVLGIEDGMDKKDESSREAASQDVNAAACVGRGWSGVSCGG